jgi:hypothetical protein
MDMKKILLGLMMAGVSVSAMAQENVCEGATATTVQVQGGKGEQVDEPVFIRNGFDFNCSNNVFLTYQEQTTTLLTVGAASAKGNEYFGGHSDGGAITSYGKCATDPCEAADAETGNSEAFEKAGGEAG